MRSYLMILVACAGAFVVTATVLAAPVQVINETWPGWSLGGDPPRYQNEPLDFDVHLSDPNIAGALNNTNNPANFVSRSGYVYTGGNSNKWAFSVESAGGTYFDFTQGTDDLSFKRNNSTGAQFRVLLSQASGAGYVVSDDTFGTSGPVGTWTAVNCDLDAMAWSTFNPATMTSGAAVTPDFASIYEVGFASLISNAAAERIDNIVANAVYVAPELIFEQWSNASGSVNIPLDPSVLSDSRGSLALDATGGGPFVSGSQKYIYTGANPTRSRRWAFSLQTATEGSIDFTQAAEDVAFREFNTGGQFRVLLSTLPGADYVVSDQTFNFDGAWEPQSLDLDALTWRALQPGLLADSSLPALGSPVTPDLTSVWEVGFASLITSGTERIDDVSIRGIHAPQTYTGPVPKLLAFEPWATWRGSDPGRQHNEPLDGALHLTDPAMVVGLNETNGDPFVSATGYVFTGEQMSNQWAFTLRHAQPTMYTDFSIGSQDLQFDQSNSQGQFRIVLAQSAGGDYVISGEIFYYERVLYEFDTQTVDLDSLAWYDFDPGLMTYGGLITPDFSHIWEVGFASLYNGGTERIDNIVILGVAVVPEPTSLLLMAMGLLGLVARRRRSGRR